MQYVLIQLALLMVLVALLLSGADSPFFYACLGINTACTLLAIFAAALRARA